MTINAGMPFRTPRSPIRNVRTPTLVARIQSVIEELESATGFVMVYDIGYVSKLFVDTIINKMLFVNEMLRTDVTFHDFDVPLPPLYSLLLCPQQLADWLRMINASIQMQRSVKIRLN